MEETNLVFIACSWSKGYMPGAGILEFGKTLIFQYLIDVKLGLALINLGVQNFIIEKNRPMIKGALKIFEK